MPTSKNTYSTQNIGYSNASMAPIPASLDEQLEDSEDLHASLPAELESEVMEYALSPMQQGMLFHSLHVQHSGVDIEQMLCTLREDLQLDAFEQAWQQVVARHPVLRTSFHWDDLDEPVQRVQPRVKLQLDRQDWWGLLPDEQCDRLDAYLKADRQRGFQLDQAPLMRLALFRIADAEYQFLWTFHHILLDGRSFPIVLREVFTIYEAFCQAQALALALPAPLPYANYIAWLQEQNLEAAEGYWRSLLKGFKTPTPLPVSQAGGDAVNQAGHAEVQLQLSVETTDALRAIAKQYQVTPNTIVQGVWALLLSRYAGTEDVVFGATRACRHATVEGAESMVGLFINTLPVRVQIAADATVMDWLQELRNQHVAIRPYEHTPLVEVQKWSDVPPGTQLFETIVVFENYLLNSALQTTGESWQNREFQLFEQPNYPLILLACLDTALLLKLDYDAQRFDHATVQRILGHFSALLEGVLANPIQPVGNLSLLTQAERHQVVVAWNDTTVQYLPHLRLHDLFEGRVERAPETIAVVFEGESITYAELNRRANQLAHRLQALGVRPEATVGICIERSLEMIVGLLAILKAGGAYVPLDPTYPADRLAHIQSDSQLAVVLTQEKFRVLLPQQEAPVVCLDTDWPAIATESNENPTSAVTAENLAYVIYTSGSTGKPKGVLIEHRGAVNTILDINDRFQVTAADRVLAVCSLNFDLSVYDVFGLLAVGGTIVLPQPAIAPDLNHWIDLMHREQVTLWNSAPPVMQMFAGHLVDHNHTLPSVLRLVMLSGDWIPLTLPNLISQLRTGKAPLDLISLGGATEASIWSILYPIEELNPGWKSVPYGKPMANQRFYILDERQQPIPVGTVGELYIGGDGVARGYHNRPDLNATKFIPDPYYAKPGSQMYRTGDLGRYMPDGNIEFLGRIDHQVKIRGFRVELGEIEAVLAQYPSLRETAVLAREDAHGTKQLVAYLVPERDRQVNGSEPENTLIENVRSLLKEKLPDYMVPAFFVLLASLPLTPNGKLDRKALPAPDWNSTHSPNQSSFVAPRNPTEQKLAEIWQEFLRVPAISIKDNFFELGGHSLLAVRIWSKVEKAFAKALPLATLFQAPTIEQLAERFGQSQDDTVNTQCPSLVMIQPGQPGNAKLPLFCIHALGRGLKFYRPMLRYLDAQQTIYGLSVHATSEDFPSDRVEDLATHYIKQIKILQPKGPYLLAGISFSGLIVYEMAQQFLVKGDKVGLVALLDTNPTSVTEVMPISAKFAAHLRNLAHLGPNYVLDKVQGKLVDQFQVPIGLMQKVSRKLGQTSDETEEQLLARLQDLMYIEQNKQSGRAYTLRPYPGKVHMLRATKQMIVLSEAGWLKLVDKLEICDIPDTHLGMLEEPCVQRLAQKLQTWINQAS